MIGTPTDNLFVQALDRLVNHMSAHSNLADGWHDLTRGNPDLQSGDHHYANMSEIFSNAESTPSARPRYMQFSSLVPPTPTTSRASKRVKIPHYTPFSPPIALLFALHGFITNMTN